MTSGRRKEKEQRTHVVSPEVGLELPSEDLERRALPNSIRTDEPEDLAGARRREPVELEGVRGVAVRDLGLEVRREVDDGDRVEGASGGVREG